MDPQDVPLRQNTEGGKLTREGTRRGGVVERTKTVRKWDGNIN
jgi:hypothetical protein